MQDVVMPLKGGWAGSPSASNCLIADEKCRDTMTKEESDPYPERTHHLKCPISDSHVGVEVDPLSQHTLFSSQVVHLASMRF